MHGHHDMLLVYHLLILQAHATDLVPMPTAWILRHTTAAFFCIQLKLIPAGQPDILIYMSRLSSLLLNCFPFTLLSQTGTSSCDFTVTCI